MSGDNQFDPNMVSADGIKKLIGQVLQNVYLNGSNLRALDHKEAGKKVTDLLLDSLIAPNNPMAKTMKLAGGNILGNYFKDIFPGDGGVGFNVNDSWMQQQYRRSVDSARKSSRSDVQDAFKEARNTHSGVFGKMGFRVLTSINDMEDIYKGFDPMQYGFSVAPGVAGTDNRFLSKVMVDRNNKIRKKLYGKDGLAKTVAAAYVEDPAEFSSMKGGELGSIIADLGSRDQLGGTNTTALKNIKETANTLKSVRDILKGPVKDVMKQLEAMFGNETINTFEIKDSGHMLNKLRMSAQLSGFAPAQLMALLPATRMLEKSVGGSGMDSGESASYTGLIMGTLRGKDKSFIDEAHMTKTAMKFAVGSQQSQLARDISSGASLIKGKDAEDTRKKKEAYYAKLREITDAGSNLSLDNIAEVTRSIGGVTDASASLIRIGSTSREAQREAHKDNRGMLLTTTQRVNEAVYMRDIAIEGALGGSKQAAAKLKTFMAKEGYDSKRDFYFNNAAMKKFFGNDTMAWKNFQDMRENGSTVGTAAEEDAIMGRLKLARARDEAARNLANFHEDTTYGSSLSMSLIQAHHGKGATKGVKNTAYALLNTNNISSKKLLRALSWDKKGRTRITPDELSGHIETITNKVMDLGLDDEMSKNLIQELLVDAMSSKNGIEGLISSGAVDETIENTRNSGYSAMRTIEYGKELEGKLKSERKSNGGKISVEKHKDIERKLQRKVLKAKVDARIAKLSDSTDKDDIAILKNLKSAAGVLGDDNVADSEIDDKLKDFKGKAGGALDGQTMGALDATEVTLMDRMADKVINTIPKLLADIAKLPDMVSEGIDTLGAAIASSGGIKSLAMYEAYKIAHGWAKKGDGN